MDSLQEIKFNRMEDDISHLKDNLAATLGRANALETAVITMARNWGVQPSKLGLALSETFDFLTKEVSFQRQPIEVRESFEQTASTICEALLHAARDRG